MIVIGEMWDFFKEKYGLILVLCVFVLLLLLAHHAAGKQDEIKFADYCLSKSGEAFAAFLGLITGAKFAGQPNGASPNVLTPPSAAEEKN